MHDPSSHSHTVLFWLCIDGRFTISDYIAGRRGCFVRTIVVLLASAVAHLFGERMSRSDWRDGLAPHPLSWRALLPGFISGCITNHGLELRRDSFYKLLASVPTTVHSYCQHADVYLHASYRIFPSPHTKSRSLKLHHHCGHNVLAPFFPLFSVFHGIIQVFIRADTKHIALLQFCRQRNDIVVKEV